MTKDTIYVVRDGEGHMSYDGDAEESEHFFSFKQAEVRARELSETSPGQRIYICKSIAWFEATVSEPRLVRSET